MNVSVSVCVIANKWVPLVSIVLFILSDAKHQREKSLMLNVTLTAGRQISYFLSKIPILSYFLVLQIPIFLFFDPFYYLTPCYCE